MSIRRDPIYISSDVWRWLRLLAKAESQTSQDEQVYDVKSGAYSQPRMYTADEIADQILRQSIREQHPQLSEHEKQIDKLEKQLIESLRINENKSVCGTGSALPTS